jgi:hypothetical protein
LGNLQGDRQEILRSRPGNLGVERTWCNCPCSTTAPANWRRRGADWKQGECDLIPGKTAPAYIAVERDYPNLYKRFTALGPLMEKIGNGGKGIAWDTKTEVHHLKALNGTVTEEGATKGMAKIDTAIDAAKMILMLAPETNGEVAVKAWAGAWQGDRPQPPPSGRGEGGRKNPLPRHRRPAAQDHLLADLVRHRERGGLLQCRLDQRA